MVRAFVGPGRRSWDPQPSLFAPEGIRNDVGQLRDTDYLGRGALVQVLHPSQSKYHQWLHQRCLHRGESLRRRKRCGPRVCGEESCLQEGEVYSQMDQRERSGSHICCMC